MLKFRRLDAQVRQSEIVKSEIAKPGGGEGIRTPDPRVANAVLCQLSYTPDTDFEFGFRIADLKSAIRNSAIRNLQRLVAGAGFEPATFGL